MKLTLLLWGITGAFCYVPPGKESYLSGIFLRDLVNRLNDKQQMSDTMSYVDLTDGLPLDGRSLTRELEGEHMYPLDYDSIGDINLHPSIRDQERLQHSSLWGMSGSAGEESEGVKNKQGMKADTLPAYCNPPNPCPVGYTGQNGCIENFENTASYSRRYQYYQDCMCDTEHMFDCPNPSGYVVENEGDIDDMDFHRFIQQSFKTNPAFPHKKLVAKKYHNYDSFAKVNPFLTGEKLRVAAKKGNNVLFY